ncbi:MAG TPA: diguanylate cyclase [Thermoanaerobaculia bacterium]|nr:diguanylate cyclase [Thermoanaerobaculia bacterium]
MAEPLRLLPAARGLAVPFSRDLESLRAMASRLATLVDSVQAGVLVEDEECRILLVNRAFCEMFALPETPDELVGWETRTILGWTGELFVDRDGFFQRIDRLVGERRPVLSEELALVDGRTFERDYVPVLTDGDYRGHFWVFRDITHHKRIEEELRRSAERLEQANRDLEATNRAQLALMLVNLELQKSLREQALHDDLTGLCNRRHLEERLDQELRRARRSGTPLAVLLLDLDRFKQVNDQHGHAAGDLLLARFARLLQETVRADDVVARYGGEEFTVVLPGAGPREAQRVAEKVRRRTQRLSLEVGERRLGTVTVSVGVAWRPECGESSEELLEAADRALYRAKGEGRNRVVAADPDELAEPAAAVAGRG